MTDRTWLELAAGLLLLLIALMWQAAVRRRSQSFLVRALGDPDPAQRRAALDVVAARGVERHVSLLLERVEQETDPSVLLAIAETVARNQWLPVDRADVATLRMWATRHLQSHAPRPAVPATPPEADSVSPPAGLAVSAVTVLVTGAGGPAGVSVIRALRSAGHRVVAVDADPMAVGLRLAQAGAVVPRCDAEEFIDRVCSIGSEYGAQALISTIAEEMTRLGDARLQLAEAGMATWLPSPDAVTNCIDKWQFAKVMKRAKLPVPATGLGNANGVPEPWIVKPRFGRGSRDVVPADSAPRLWWALDVVPDPIVQTRCEGREFTVDALVDPGGVLVAAVPRWRLETKAGISTKGVTFTHRGVTDAVRDVLAALDLRGPVNVQGFVQPDDAVTIIEVNPRFSGGLPLSIAAGADLVGQYLNGILGLPVRADRLTYRTGVRMLRYFEEVIEASSDGVTDAEQTPLSAEPDEPVVAAPPVLVIQDPDAGDQEGEDMDAKDTDAEDTDAKDTDAEDAAAEDAAAEDPDAAGDGEEPARAGGA